MVILSPGFFGIGKSSVQRRLKVAAKAVRAGKSKVPHPMFVKMSTNEQWLNYATHGAKFIKTNVFGKDSLLLHLRDHVEKACDGHGALKETVDAGADYDPMNEVCDVCDDDAKDGNSDGGGVKRARYSKNVAKHRFLEVDMAMHPPEIVRNCTAKKSVLLFIVDRRQIWLRLTDVVRA